jgi:hypothetical protein
MSKEDMAILTEPTGSQDMTGHAEQHSALTRIQRDNVVKFEALEFDLPKFYASGKRIYKVAQSVSDAESSFPWFVAATSHTNGTGNAWPGNANAIHLYYDADQHDMIATGAGTILIFDKEDGKIMMHAVVTGTPTRANWVSGRECWSFEIVSIEALGRQWVYGAEYEMTLSGVFWDDQDG